MNLSNDIISFLFSFRKITLPGLGTLILKRHSSQRNPIKNKLKGPDFYCEFRYNKYDLNAVKNFVEFISNKYKITPHKADSKFRKYSLELLNNIANFGTANIENLGKFSRKKDNLIFNFSHIFENIIDTSYPEYPLVAIKRPAEARKNNEIVDRNQINSSIKKNNRNNTNWIFPLIILTLASIVLICFLNCLFNTFEKFNANNGIKPVKTDSIHKNKTGIVSNSDDEFPFDTLERETETVQNDSINEMKSSEIKDSHDSSLYSVIDTFDINKNNPETFETSSESLKKVTLEELIKMAPELRKSYEKSCIIITGSFIKKFYAKKMIERLYNSGFSPYSEKYGKFHRTGVIFDCNKKPLKDFLKELKNTIEPGSWVLKWK